MIKEIIRLSKQLILIPSTKDRPKDINKVLDVSLDELKGFKFVRFLRNNSPSVLVFSGKTRPAKFRLILNAHLDVVPGKAEQYKPYEKNGRLYGRGADDMKAGAAVMILVFKQLAKQVNYPIALQLVTDEEVGGRDGVRYQVERGVKTDFFIAGESTNLNIKNEAKGLVWLKVRTDGTTAHGAYLWRGDNALQKLIFVVEKINQIYPVPKNHVWKTTCNLAKISTTNMTPNKVPDNAEAILDIRYIAKDGETVVRNIKKVVGSQAKLEYLEKEPVHFTSTANNYIRNLKKICQSIVGKKVNFIKGAGASDARHYSRVGIAGVEFGPVGSGLHSDNEWVDIKSLSDYYLVLKKFLLSI